MKFTGIMAVYLVGAALAVSAARAAEGSACDMHLSVTDVTGGRKVMLVNPSITVREGQSASISVTTDGTTYSFDVVVSSEQGRLIASTKAKVTKGQELLASPRVTAVVGEPASLTVGPYMFVADARLAKVGA